MDEERKRTLLRRVDKLLKQADGTTFAEEAETALLMAQRVLAENGMTMAEVNALSEEEQKKLVANEELVDMGRRSSAWLMDLAGVLCQNFRCKYYIGGRWVNYASRKQTRQLRVIGLEDDVAVVRDVFTHARGMAERLATAYAQKPGIVDDHLRAQWKSALWATPAEKAGATREIKRIWLEGFCAGLRARFAEQVKLSTSLALMVVVHPVVRDAYDELGLRGAPWRSHAGDVSNGRAKNAGFQAGKAYQPVRPERLTTPTPRLKSGS